jgi:pSer/pThr/pTyr-binding forkhead associated (FHA) protein
VDDPRVSQHHARLEWVHDHWELKDLASTNGTFVDGHKIDRGGRRVLPPGAVFTLGGRQLFQLVDASPPEPSARHTESGVIRVAAEGFLALPSDDHPAVSIFEDPNGQWVAEEGDDTRVVMDQDVVVAEGERWILDLPGAAGVTQEQSVMLPTLETISMRFAVSRDEEHIEISIAHDGGTVALPARTHHYLLLTLARAAISDEGASPAERGWVDREVLCRMLATDPRKLNVDVFRVRKQLSDLGIHGATGIIARRPGTGQLRLGTHRVEVTKL